MTGMTSTTTTTEFGIILKSTAMTIGITMQAKKTAISSAVQTAMITTMTVTMPTLTKTDSSKQFGTVESCHKACENPHFMTSTTTTTAFQMLKTPMTTTTVFSMSTKRCSPVVSGAKKNHRSTTTTMVSSTGQTTIGTAMESPMLWNSPSALPKRLTTTTTGPETTLMKTMTKTA